jgi:hypothetical protein
MPRKAMRRGYAKHTELRKDRCGDPARGLGGCADDAGDYDGVLKSLGSQGDFKIDVLKVNIPGNDLKMSIDGISTPTPFGCGGWLALNERRRSQRRHDKRFGPP